MREMLAQGCSLLFTILPVGHEKEALRVGRRVVQDTFRSVMPPAFMSWLVAGGLLYTGGVPFFMLADYRLVGWFFATCALKASFCRQGRCRKGGGNRGK